MTDSLTASHPAPTPPPVWTNLTPEQQRRIVLVLAEILRKHLAATQAPAPQTEAHDACNR
jgi:hypothetical protein